MSTDRMIKSEGPRNTYVCGAFNPSPETSLNIVRFGKLLFVLTDDAKLVSLHLIDEL